MLSAECPDHNSDKTRNKYRHRHQVGCDQCPVPPFGQCDEQQKAAHNQRRSDSADDKAGTHCQCEGSHNRHTEIRILNRHQYFDNQPFVKTGERKEKSIPHPVDTGLPEWLCGDTFIMRYQIQIIKAISEYKRTDPRDYSACHKHYEKHQGVLVAFLE